VSAVKLEKKKSVEKTLLKTISCFLAGKIFSATRVFRNEILKCGAQEIFAKNYAFLEAVKLPLLAGLCSEFYHYQKSAPS